MDQKRWVTVYGAIFMIPERLISFWNESILVLFTRYWTTFHSCVQVIALCTNDVTIFWSLLWLGQFCMGKSHSPTIFRCLWRFLLLKETKFNLVSITYISKVTKPILSNIAKHYSTMSSFHFSKTKEILVLVQVSSQSIFSFWYYFCGSVSPFFYGMRFFLGSTLWLAVFYL